MNWLIAIISAAGAGALVAVVAWIRDLRIRVALAELRAADAQALAERLSAREIAASANRSRTKAELVVVEADAEEFKKLPRDEQEAVIWAETGQGDIRRAR